MFFSMSNFNRFQAGNSILLVLAISATTIASALPLSPAAAQVFVSQRGFDNEVSIPRGTQIPVELDQEKILVAEDETLPVTLKVAANIRSRNRQLLIPYGSQIVGRIEPTGGGSRFTAEKLIIDERKQYNLYASSLTVSRTQTIEEGATTADILKGTLAGAGAATIISGVTGDRKIEALEVLAGAAVGTLAGWALPESGVIGGYTKQVVVIYPSSDLTLTLDRDLYLR